MNKDLIFKFFIFSIFILFISFLIIFQRKSVDSYIKYEYGEIIQDIRFSYPKKTPSVLLNSKWVDMQSYGSVASEDLSIGDSICKIKNSDIIFLYKRDSTNWYLYKYFKYFPSK